LLPPSPARPHWFAFRSIAHWRPHFPSLRSLRLCALIVRALRRRDAEITSSSSPAHRPSRALPCAPCVFCRPVPRG
jgi:hypothetical protein